jgi:taurine dioxygenase
MRSMPYETIAVEPLTAVIGAEIRGVDLARPIPERQVAEIREALLRHLVVFFRGQELSEPEHLAFAAHFGPPVSASIAARDGDDGLFVVLEDTEDSPPKADRWHTDVPFVEEPPNFAVLCMRATPPVGGDTLWASLYAAYDSLSPTMQSAIADLELDVGLGTTAATIRELYGETYYRRVMDQFEGVRHPLVRIHPETRRPALYLSGSFMRDIVGMTAPESELLLGFLASRLDDPNVQCRWRWQEHDVVMWDERCTNHRAVSDHYPNYRMVRRVLVGHGAPIPVSRA